MKDQDDPRRARFSTYLSTHRSAHLTFRRAACLTLLAIVGTLCACGRYGPPKRVDPPAPAASPTSAPAPNPDPSPSPSEPGPAK